MRNVIYRTEFCAVIFIIKKGVPMRSKRIHTLTECAVMLALSVALSFVKLFEMPMGGSVTLASMLPVMVVAIRHGWRWGLPTAFLYAGFQLLQAYLAGNVFVYCETPATMMICILFDYVLPFTLIGFAGIFRRLSLGKIQNFGIYLGIFAVTAVRFGCHFISGVAIWGQWAEGMSPTLYSFLYNGSFLLPELLITLFVAVLLFEQKAIDIRGDAQYNKNK